MTSQQTRRKNIDFKSVVIPAVLERLDGLRKKGIVPTLREIFYYVVSVGLIPNTRSKYNSLSKATVQARDNGTLAEGCFVDNSRSIIDIDDIYISPETRRDYHIDLLKNLGSEYSNCIPRWHKQPHYVEVWIEKDSLSATFEKILERRQVRIVPNRGWSSRTFENDNFERLKAKHNEGKSVHLLYFGDLDPSGDRMFETLSRRLHECSLSFVDLLRVAVTEEQIPEYGLEHLQNPDPETKEKLENRDSNSNWFRKRHDDRVYQIELEAMSMQYDRFYDLVLAKVDQYFDENIYNRILKDKRHSRRYINGLVNRKVKFLDENEDTDDTR